MTREEAKGLFKSDIDAYGKPRHIMKNIDKIYDEFEAEHPLPPAEGATDKFRDVLHEVQRLIETEGGATESEMKAIWNSLSCAITESERRPQPTAEGAEARAGEWKLIGHSHQIADTGDYDGYWEITNGKVSIYTQDDDDEALQPIVDALNDSGCKFYLDDANAVENYILRHDIAELKERLAQIEQHPTAEGAEEILRKPKYNSLKNLTLICEAMEEFATLHAQRIAEKMVEEMLRKELIAYDKWAMRHLNGAGEIFTTERAVDEYLKSKEQ